MRRLPLSARHSFRLGCSELLGRSGWARRDPPSAEDIAARRDNAEPKTYHVEPKIQNVEPKTKREPIIEIASQSHNAEA